MSIVGALDSIAVKVETLAGIKRCYSATGSGVSENIRPIPRGIDDGPVAVVWVGSADVEGGTHEGLSIDMRVDVWVQAEDAGWAYKTLTAFLEPLAVDREPFR